jgi:ferredoxin
VLNSLIKVTVLDKNCNKLKEFSMRKGSNLWVYLRKNGLPIGSACSGVGVCAACDVKLTILSQDSVSEQNDFEKQSLIRNNKNDNNRLACMCRVYHDISVQADYW